MIRLINGLTGTDMWVTEERLPVALSKGHRLPDQKPAEAPVKAEKAPAKKSTAKKK